MFTGRFPSFYKLLRAGCCLKNLLDLVPGLQGHYYHVFCHVLAAGLGMMVHRCVLGRFSVP